MAPGYRFALPCGARNFCAVTADGLKFRPLRKKRDRFIRLWRRGRAFPNELRSPVSKPSERGRRLFPEMA